MTAAPSPTITIREGSPAVRSADVAEVELEASRRALALLKKVVPADEMGALLAPEVERSDAEFREVVERSQGRSRSSVQEFLVEGLTADAFRAWWETNLQQAGAVVDWHPEHYHQGEAGGATTLEMTERVWGRVTRVCVELVDVSTIPLALAPESVFHTAVRLRLADGTELGCGLHQYRNEGPDAMVARYEALVPEALPEELVNESELHLVLEASRWFDWARADLAGAGTVQS